MKSLLRTFILIAALSFGIGDSAQAYVSRTFTTGEDWVEKMSVGEKFMSILVPSVLFQSYGVPIRGGVNEYIALMDKILAFNPLLLDEDVVNIFASTVYRFEPETRPALEELEERFLRGDMALNPHLSLYDKLPE